MPYDRQQLAALAYHAAVVQGAPADRREAVADDILAEMEQYLAAPERQPVRFIYKRDPETGLQRRVAV